MFRRFVTYLVSFGIAFHPISLHASNPDVTVLQARSAYRMETDKGPVDCIKVKRAKTGDIQLDFDPSLNKENSTYYLVLDDKAVGLVAYLNAKLNLVGFGKDNFKLAAAATYSYPSFAAQLGGDLTVEGGAFTKDSIFIAENITTRGAFKGPVQLAFVSKGTMDFTGTYNIEQISISAAALQLNAIAEAADISVQAKKISEAKTNRFYTRNNIVITGYDQGFTHRGELKAKNAVALDGGNYTTEAGAQTLAGCMLQNDSTTTNEAGRVVAGVYVGNGQDITFLPTADVLSYYFIPQIKGKLNFKPGSKMRVINAAPVWAEGNIALKGNLDKITSSSANFPHLEFFGFGILQISNRLELAKKIDELDKLRTPVFSKIKASGVALCSAADVAIGPNGHLKSPDANIVIQGINVESEGQIAGGFFEDLHTTITAHTAQLKGVVSFPNVTAFIDDVIKTNGQIRGKLNVIFTEAERKKKAAEALAAQKKAAEEAAQKAAEAERMRVEKEAAAAAAAKAEAARVAREAAEAKRVRTEKEAAAAAAAKAEAEKKQKEAEAARLAKEAAVKAQKEARRLLKQAQAEDKAAKAAKYAKSMEVAEKANLIGDVTVSNADKVDLKGGVLREGSVAIDAKTLVQAKDNKILDAQQVQLAGGKHTMAGEVKAQEYVQNTTESIDIQESAKIAAEKQSHYRTKVMTAAGETTCKGESSTVVDKYTTTETAKNIAASNYVEAKEADHKGEIGGDKVHVKVDKMKEAASAKIGATKEAYVDIKEGDLDGKNHAPTIHVEGGDVKVGGSVTGDNVSTHITKLEEKATGEIAGKKQTHMTGDHADLKGKTGDTNTVIVMEKSLKTAADSEQKGSESLYMKAPDLTQGGKADAAKAHVEADNLKIAKTGSVHSTVASEIIGHKTYDNKGKLTSKGTMYEEVPDAHKIGYVKAEKGLTVKSQLQPDVAGIWAGQYADLKRSNGLFLIVPNAVRIGASPVLNMDLGLTAPTISASTNLMFKQDVALVADKGRLNLRDVSGKKVYLEGKKGASFGRVAYRDGATVKSGSALAFRDHFTGKGTAHIEATSIYNPLNNRVDGDILSLEATQSDILNRGLMQGRKLLKRIAGGAITDECTWGHHGNTPYVTPAQAIGGTGVEIDIDGQKHNVGLITMAGYKARNIGSHVSTGAGADAIIDATYGIENISQAQRYLAASWTKKGSFGKRTHYEEWSNVVALAKEFIGGRMLRSSEKGGLDLNGSFHAGQGEDISNVFGPIRYLALVLNNSVHISKKRFWGAVRSSMHQDTQEAVVVRFLNNTGVYHTSRTAGIYGQGTQFVTPELMLKAKKRITFDEALLNNSIRTKSSAFSPTISGIPLFGGNGLNAMPGVSLYNDLRGMGQSDADVGRFVGGLSQTWSQITGLANAYNNGQLAQQVAAQFGEIGFTFTKTKSVQNWQTSAPATMHVGKAHFISEEGVDFLGGTQFEASEAIKVTAPEWILRASRKESSSQSKSVSFGGGFNPWTYSASLNFGMNRSNSHGVHYDYAQVRAPVVDVGVMDLLGLYGGAINCNKINGKVKKVDVVTLQDEFHGRNSGFGINLSSNFANGFNNPTGGFNFNFGSSHMKQAHQHAGIFAAGGFDKNFHIDQLNVTDTHLDPALAAQANRVNFVQIYDVNKNHSFGLGMQGLDLSSGEAFANGFAKNAAVLAAGAVAAELGKAVGLNEQVAQVIAMVAAAGVSNEINEAFGEKVQAPASGIGILGHLNYANGNHEVKVTGVDFSLKNLNRALDQLSQAAHKLFAPETVEVPQVEVPVIKLPEEEVIAEPVFEEQVSNEEEDRPALRLKTDDDKDNVEDEPKVEKKKPVAKKKPASDEGKERVDDSLLPMDYFGLPKVARDLIENAPLIFAEFVEPAEQRVDERVRDRAEMFDTGITRTYEKMADFYDDYHTEATAVLRDPSSSFLDRINAWCMVQDENVRDVSNKAHTVLGLRDMAIYGPEAWNTGMKYVSIWASGGKPNQALMDDFSYSAERFGFATLQVGAGSIFKFGKKMAGGLKAVFTKQNKGPNVIGFLKNPRAGVWESYDASYSADLDMLEDYNYSRIKAEWTKNPKAPFNVHTHGNSYEILVRTPGGPRTVNAKGFSKILRANPEYIEGTPIHLYSCNTGKRADGFAHQLANRMNVPVFAPTELMWLHGDGVIAIGKAKVVWGDRVVDIKALGESKMFAPNNWRPVTLSQGIKQSKARFLRTAKNLMFDDVGSGKSPFNFGKTDTAHTFLQKKGLVPFVDDLNQSQWTHFQWGKKRLVGAREDGSVVLLDQTRGPIEYGISMMDRHLNDGNKVAKGPYVVVAHGDEKRSGVQVGKIVSQWPYNNPNLDDFRLNPMLYNIKAVPVDARVFSKIVKRDPDFDKQRLLVMASCYTTDQYAQQVANATGAVVLATNDVVRLYDSGGLMLRKNQPLDDGIGHFGQWKLFQPGNKSVLSSSQGSQFIELGAGQSDSAVLKAKMKQYYRMKNSPNGRTVDDARNIADLFGLRWINGTNHDFMEFPDGSRVGISKGRDIHSGVSRKIVKTIEKLKLVENAVDLANK